MTKEHSFISYLETLAKKEDRAALAALRRGLGQPPGTVADMFPYVVRWLPNEAYANSWTEQTYYLIAALYAMHPNSVAEENLGGQFAQTLESNSDRNGAIERRFTTLLTAHPDDLASYLRQAISYLRSKEIAVNWHRLMWDVLAWEHPDRRTWVQKAWAARFWGRRDDDKSDDKT